MSRDTSKEIQALPKMVVLQCSHLSQFNETHSTFFQSNSPTKDETWSQPESFLSPAISSIGNTIETSWFKSASVKRPILLLFFVRLSILLRRPLALGQARPTRCTMMILLSPKIKQASPTFMGSSLMKPALQPPPSKETLPLYWRRYPSTATATMVSYERGKGQVQ